MREKPSLSRKPYGKQANAWVVGGLLVGEGKVGIRLHIASGGATCCGVIFGVIVEFCRTAADIHPLGVLGALRLIQRYVAKVGVQQTNLHIIGGRGGTVFQFACAHIGTHTWFKVEAYLARVGSTVSQCDGKGGASCRCPCILQASCRNGRQDNGLLTGVTRRYPT